MHGLIGLNVPPRPPQAPLSLLLLNALSQFEIEEKRSKVKNKELIDRAFSNMADFISSVTHPNLYTCECKRPPSTLAPEKPHTG